MKGRWAMKQDFHGDLQVNLTWFFAFFSGVHRLSNEIGSARIPHGSIYFPVFYKMKFGTFSDFLNLFTVLHPCLYESTLT